MDSLVEVVKHGSALHVDAAVQKLSSQLNKPNSSEVFPLHVAVWRNHLPVIERLLAAGAWTTCADGESGWTPLHRALYLGHLAAAAKLLQAGASVETCDLQGRTPVDLVSVELRCMPAEGTARCSAIYSWGSGANYQLGTGSTDFHLNPLRVEALQGLGVVAVVAAKFHSAALTADGRLLTWGWGRGGRLGHPDYNIHSGESALIHPWQVAGLGRRVAVSVAAAKHHMVVATSTGDLWTWGGNRDGKLGYPNVDTQPTPRKVDFRGRALLVAASNRHSACLTTAGEVWTWGANNDGQLGYGTNNSANNPTPRLVEAMKGKALVALSLSKRHTVVLTADGDAFTWGHKVVTPRRVPLAGSRDTARLAAVQQQQQQSGGALGTAAANAAALPAGAHAGAANTIGTNSNTSSSSAGAAAGAAGLDVRFHRNHAEVVRPEAALVAAGYSHTTVVTRPGEVLCWRSADPGLRAQEVTGLLAGKRVVAVAAAKTRTVVCTDTGLSYMWECKERTGAGGGKGHTEGLGLGGGGQASEAAAGAAGAGGQSASVPLTTGCGAAAAPSQGAASGMGGGGVAATDEVPLIVPSRVPGLTRVAHVAVGEKHTLALQAWTVPPMPDEHGAMPQLRRRHRRQRSDASGSSGSGSEDVNEDVSSGGGWRRASWGSFRATSGSLTRGNSGLGASTGPVLGSTPPPCSSPMARSWGLGVNRSPGSGMPSGSGGGGAADSLMGVLARRGRRQVAAVAPPDGDDPGGPGWALFSHRPAADGDTGTSPSERRRRSSTGTGRGDDGDDDVFSFGDAGNGGPGARRRRSSGGGGVCGLVPSLQVVCQRVVASQLVEPRTALPILEYADVAGAALLRCYCLAVAIANLDCALLEAPGGLTGLPPHLLAELEHLYREALLAPPPSAQQQGQQQRAGATAPAGTSQPLGNTLTGDAADVLGSSPAGSGSGSAPCGSSSGGPDSQLAALEAFHRRRALISRLQLGRRPTAAPLWLAGAAAADRMAPQASSRVGAAALAALGAIGHSALPGHQPTAAQGLAAGAAAGSSGAGALGQGEAAAGGGGEAEGEVQRLARHLQRKLQQIAGLEELQRGGRQLDAQQQAKLNQRGALQEALMALASGANVEAVKQAIAHSAEVASRLGAKLDAGPGTSSGGAAAAAAGAGRAGGSGSSQGGSSGRAGASTRGAWPGPASTQASHQQQQSGAGKKRGPKEGIAEAARAASMAVDGGPQGATVGAVAAGATTCGADAEAASEGAAFAGPPATPAGARLPVAAQPSGSTTSGAAAAVGSGKKQQRRGGLSMFLSGALDQRAAQQQPVVQPQPAAAPAVPKGPAWGGAKLPAAPAGGSSLRELLSQLPQAAAPPPTQQLQPSLQLQPPPAATSPGPPSRSSARLTPAAPGLPARSPSGPLPLPLAQAATASTSGLSIAAAAAAAVGSAAASDGSRKPVAPAAALAPKTPAAATTAAASLGQVGMSIAAAAWGGGGGGSGGVKLSLAEFMAGRTVTAPLQVAPAQRVREHEEEKEPAGPAWGGVPGSSPMGTRSLLSIQAEQAQIQKRAAASWVRPAGASGAAGGASGPAGAVVTAAAPAGSSPPPPRSMLLGPAQPPQQHPSKWYVPEQCQPSVAAKPLTAIQIEERAIKEISALYGGRVVARVVAHGSLDAAAHSGVAPAGGSGGKGAAAAAQSGSGSGAAAEGGPAATGRSRKKSGKGNAS